jgi:hypothetical protein
MRDWEDVKVKFDGNSTEHIKLDYGLIAVSKPSLALLCQSARCVRTQLVRLARVLQHTMPWPFLSVRPAVGTTVNRCAQPCVVPGPGCHVPVQ